MPLEMENYGCYNKGKKKDFQSPFHFLISLFSWTPRDRLVNDPGALHVRRPDSQFVHGWVMLDRPLGGYLGNVRFFCIITKAVCINSQTAFYISSLFSGKYLPAKRYPQSSPGTGQPVQQSYSRSMQDLQSNTTASRAATFWRFLCCMPLYP